MGMIMRNGVPYGHGSEIPEGGTKGQVLAKASNISGDFEWVNGGGGSGYDDTELRNRISTVETQKATGYFERTDFDIPLSTTGQPAFALAKDSFKIEVENHKPYTYEFTASDVYNLAYYNETIGKTFIARNEDNETIHVKMTGPLPDNVQYAAVSSNPVLDFTNATTTLTKTTFLKQIDEMLIPAASGEVFIFDVNGDDFTEDPQNPGGKHYGTTITSPTFEEIMDNLVSDKLVFAKINYNSGNSSEMYQLFRTSANSIRGKAFDLEFPQGYIWFYDIYVQKRNYETTTYFGVFADKVTDGGSGETPTLDAVLKKGNTSTENVTVGNLYTVNASGNRTDIEPAGISTTYLYEGKDNQKNAGLMYDSVYLEHLEKQPNGTYIPVDDFAVNSNGNVSMNDAVKQGFKTVLEVPDFVNVNNKTYSEITKIIVAGKSPYKTEGHKVFMYQGTNYSPNMHIFQNLTVDRPSSSTDSAAEVNFLYVYENGDEDGDSRFLATEEQMGDLYNLTTSNKSNIVAAINEVNAKGGGLNFEVGVEKWQGTYTENGVTYQVYSKIIKIDALPNTAGITTYSHGISGIKQILQVYGFTTDGFVLNAPRQNTQDNIAIYQVSKSASNQTLSIEVGKDRSNKAAYVCLVYAKNN